MANDLLDEKDEDAIPEDLQYKVYDDIVDRNSMLRPISSIPLASIDITNADNPRVDLLIQKQICALYQERDEGIRTYDKIDILTIYLVIIRVGIHLRIV